MKRLLRAAKARALRDISCDVMLVTLFTLFRPDVCISMQCLCPWRDVFAPYARVGFRTGLFILSAEAHGRNVLADAAFGKAVDACALAIGRFPPDCDRLATRG